MLCCRRDDYFRLLLTSGDAQPLARKQLVALDELGTTVEWYKQGGETASLRAPLYQGMPMAAVNVTGMVLRIATPAGGGTVSNVQHVHRGAGRQAFT